MQFAPPLHAKIKLAEELSCKRLKMQFRYEKRLLVNLNLLRELIRVTGKTIEVQKWPAAGAN